MPEILVAGRRLGPLRTVLSRLRPCPVLGIPFAGFDVPKGINGDPEEIEP